MSPHQSGQRASSGRSLLLADSRSHRSDRAQTRRPSNCLIGFSPCSFFDLVRGGADALRVKPGDLIDLRQRFLLPSVVIWRKRATLRLNGLAA